jgi:glycosyltransferase involved in cell wall biosynthesis
VMIGLVSVDLGELAHLPNMVFIGPQPYETLPHWVKAFDVGLQPYVLNSQTYHSNPLKLREYLAAGKPVVSISVPEVERFKDHVGTAHDYEEFLQRIEEALATDSKERQRERQSAVANMTWERCVAEAWCIVEERLEKSRPVARQSVAGLA